MHLFRAQMEIETGDNRLNKLDAAGLGGENAWGRDTDKRSKYTGSTKLPSRQAEESTEKTGREQ